MHENDKENEDGLRDRLVRVGVELLDAEGIQALSLREIARRAGVSHGAPRRYFPAHLDLLSAIARQGFAQLANRVAEEDPEGASARERIEVLARVYLDYADTRRGMFELMFRHDLLESGRLGLRETSLPLFAHLTALVARVRPGAEPAVLAGALWANLHGLAQLWHWGSLRLATGGDDPGPLLTAALDAHLGPSEPTP
ncbi:TetR/AcrR family transcriptional regulator [Streptomyces tanashiensis]|uniref:TetR/AcrR family transcriptional regulator n=1 Tax=Streptomyces tanashiensis TaxID=67367 RepID=A0ABY6QPY2_9ACTN|nr:TetR/AcrR family transcriptional regulator [Streptomyces tanashiensis]UZX19667.1 TetR/AcrR family transcriptional regulator [Streptomyces tanashiensis]GGY18517.1 TetR family transcriptional regulator [Streptomyces tanashiensis]